MRKVSNILITSMPSMYRMMFSKNLTNLESQKKPQERYKYNKTSQFINKLFIKTQIPSSKQFRNNRVVPMINFLMRIKQRIKISSQTKFNKINFKRIFKPKIPLINLNSSPRRTLSINLRKVNFNKNKPRILSQNLTKNIVFIIFNIYLKIDQKIIYNEIPNIYLKI